MKKIEIVDSIVSKVDHVNCFITRIYGAGFGVGYDLDINLFLKTNGAIVSILAHAARASWASVGHLRLITLIISIVGAVIDIENELLITGNLILKTL